MKKLLIFIFFGITLFANPVGELSFYLMKDGKPLANQTVDLLEQKDAKYKKYASFTTDSDGYISSTLPAGLYQLQVVVKDKAYPQAFIRKNFLIKEDKESQLIVSLKADNTILFEDEEAPRLKNLNTKKIKEKKLRDGFCQLHISSSEDKKAIEDARVFVKGLNIDLKSDEKGALLLEIPEGNQTLSIIHSDFSSQTLKVTIIADETLMKYVELTPAAMELEEFVVLAPHIEGSIASVVAEEKNSESIANIIGSEQMSKQGDSNAASALKRVAGITIMGGKYIYVRGLGDRYSATELNSMPLPSPNPIKRTVPLDMFPSSVIGSLQVQKSFSPDIIGAFGGGYVNIRTKKFQDDDYAKIKFELKANSTTGDSATSYKGSSSDSTGSDDGYRSFDDTFISSLEPTVGQRQPDITLTPQEMQTLLQSRSLNKEKTTVPFGKKVELELSKNFKISSEQQINVFATYQYSNEAKIVDYKSYDYLLSSDGVQSDTADNSSLNSLYKENIQHGGLFNISYNYKDFNIAYTKLYVLNTTNQTRDVSGTFGENNSIEQQTYLEWQERELDINQFTSSFKYTLYFTNIFDFGYEKATASEFVPNDIYYNYITRDENDPFTFKKYESQLTYSRRTTDDDLTSLNLKNKTSIPIFSEDDYIELGYTNENKDRVGRQQNIRVQSRISDTDVSQLAIDDIINYTDGSMLNYDLISRPKDNYDASLKRDAFYFKSLLKPSEMLSITFGARKVDMTQSVDQYTIENNLVTTTNNTLVMDKLLPSLGVKYTLDTNNIIKFGYSQSFVYPDFREFVDAEFIHPVFIAKVSGNPDLVETDIQNIDTRYEHYFNDIDSISIALFYKYMDNPIEDTTEFTTSTLSRFSFDNASSATLYGIELSWYKNLEFISPYMEHVTFSGNYTYISSDVTLNEEQKAKYVTQERGLQGLSPQVLNLSIAYQKDDRSLNLSYNKMSRRLMRVALKNGDTILGLDDYEEPPHLLDFTWIEKFNFGMFENDSAMSFKIKNILNSETVWEQGSKTTLRYKTGTSYSVSLSTKI